MRGCRVFQAAWNLGPPFPPSASPVLASCQCADGQSHGGAQRKELKDEQVPVKSTASCSV